MILEVFFAIFLIGNSSPFQGEDLIRESGIPYAIVRPCALTEEPSGADIIFDQGDNITVVIITSPPILFDIRIISSHLNLLFS